MKALTKTLAAFLLAALFIGCDKPNPDDNLQKPGDNVENPGDDNPGDDGSGDENQTPAEPEEDFDVKYVKSDENFCNPERGWYKYTSKSFKDGIIPEPFTVDELRTARDVAGMTLIYSYYYLTDFIDKELSQEALDVIAKCLEANRGAGVKSIVRFAYKDNYRDNDKPWDAPIDIVLRQVEQLAPIFKEYEDVIYVVQAGFVGSWGEWYYTDHFGFEPKTVEDYKPRKRLIDALLKAVPKSRQIAVRYPEAKFRMFDIELSDTITAATAFNGSDLSRIAGHNDCFISSANDVGTYKSGNDKRLWEAETQYVIMGGETCKPVAMYCDCVPSYKALETYHWSYLNASYNKGTYAIWKESGCYDDITLRLGYRLVLLGANFEKDFAAGQEFPVEFKIKNIGFASLINERGAEFVITEKGLTEPVYRVDLNVDPRTWKAGQKHTVNQTLSLPAELEAGKEYVLYLNLPDVAPTLSSNPEFSVRLANEDVWDGETGYNKLATFTAK